MVLPIRVKVDPMEVPCQVLPVMEQVHRVVGVGVLPRTGAVLKHDGDLDQ